MHDTEKSNPYASPRCADAPYVEQVVEGQRPYARKMAQLGAWGFLIAGIPSYIACGVLHICMAGHMRHPPYSWWDHVLDAAWIAGVVAGVVLCVASRCRSWKRMAIGGTVLLISRSLLASGGGGLFLLELPLIGVVVFAAISNLGDGTLNREPG